MSDSTIEALCSEADDPMQPCRFAGTCHRARQELQRRLQLRGEDCWAFSMLRIERAYEPVGGPGPSSPEGSGV
jgi:hypothetical protein